MRIAMRRQGIMDEFLSSMKWIGGIFSQMMSLKLSNVLSGRQPQVIHIMNQLITPDDRVLNALQASGITDNLRDFEISVLTGLLTLKYYEAGVYTSELSNFALKDALMILIEGKIEVSATVNNEPVLLQLESPGDLAKVMSFVGDNKTNISVMLNIRRDSAVLLLQRSKLESLMHSHPSIVYTVMRNLVQHIHGVARRKYAEKEQLSNYVFGLNFRY